jgi:LacI family transcriptional regulator
MKNPNTTLKDIARIAEVSKATVSLAINGSPKVNARTSAKIWSIIRDLQYEPSVEARKLAQKRWEIPSSSP